MRRPRAPDDPVASLLREIARGNPAHFSELYDRTSTKLFGICLRVLGDRQEAEEALQDVYGTIWRRAASYDPERGRAMTWLLTLTRNHAIDRLRRTRNIATAPIILAETVIDERVDTARQAERGEEECSLDDCLALLSDDDAALIRKAFLEGSSYAELAERSGIPLSTLKSRVRRAFMRIRACLPP